MTGASSFSVAASRSSRLRARSAARTGLRQAISRSPGKSGEVISARSCSSKRLSWSGPSSAISLRDLRGAQRGDPPVSVATSLSSLQRLDPGGGDHAAVADHDHVVAARTCPSPRRRSAVNAAGSAVLPANTRTATGRPSGSVSSPYSICSCLSCRRGSSRARPAGSTEPSSHELDRSNSAIRAGLPPGPGAGGPAPPRSRPAGRPASPSRRRSRRWTRRRRRGRRPGWCRPTRSGWTASSPGGTTREMIRARARSRCGPPGPAARAGPACGPSRARRRRARAAATG